MKRSAITSIFILLVVLVGLALIATTAHAATDLTKPDASTTDLLTLVQNNAKEWAGKLQPHAIKLFWMLAVISFIWTFFPLAIKGADFSEITGELIRFVLVIGFFAWLLTPGKTGATTSVDVAQAVINSFRQAGAEAGSFTTPYDKALDPGTVFGKGVDLAIAIGNVETWNPLTAFLLALAALVMLICFVFIAAFMFVTLVESYIVVYGSVIFLGFAGSQWTRDYAMAMFRYAVAVGAKLFVLSLIVAIILKSANDWVVAFQNSGHSFDGPSVWTMVGLALLCAYLAKTIPDLIQGLITGSSLSGGHTVGSMAAVAAAATAAAVTAGISAAAAGGGAAASSAGGSSAAGGSPGLANALSTSSASGSGASTGGASNSPTVGASRIGGGGSNSTAARAGNGSSEGGTTTAKKAAANTKQQDDKEDKSTPAQQKGDEKPNPLWRAAETTLKGVGHLSALTVPGMESASGLSLGPHPNTGSGSENTREPGEEFKSDPFPNLITPAAAAPKDTPQNPNGDEKQ